MSSKLCEICNYIFINEQVLRVAQPHQKSYDSLQKSVATGCYICSVILKSFGIIKLPSDFELCTTWYLSPVIGLPNGWLKLTIETDEEVEGETDLVNDEDVDDAQTQNSKDQELEEEPETAIWGFVIQHTTVNQSIGSYDVPSSFNSDELFALARKWFETCKSDHSRCSGASKNDFHPTRLVDLESLIHMDSVNLVISTEDNVQGPYATLSHCWGKAKTLKLLTQNIAELRAGIEITALPTSYQEAITTAKRLGLKYLWIDSLCIIQDSVADWGREAAQMGAVYQSSALNIAAAGAAENSDPCFSQRDPSTIRPVLVETTWGSSPQNKYYLIDEGIRSTEVEYSPLRQRAWVVQEVWLSPRVLNFTKTQLWWECVELEACEAYPNGVPNDWFVSGGSGFTSRKFKWADDVESMHRRWNRLAEQYSACKLTVLSDRMMAFSGIAQSFTRLLSDDYIAGLWRSQLPQQLLWETRKFNRRVFRPPEYRSPSWSWISVEGPMVFNHIGDVYEETRVLCQLVDVQIHLTNNQPGLLKGGLVVLQGPLTAIKFKDLKTALLDSEDYIESFSGPSEERIDLGSKSGDIFPRLDESTDEYQPSFTYFDGVDQAAVLQGNMEKATQSRQELSSPGVSLFYLPILEWKGEGLTSIIGLIVCQVNSQPNSVYHRIGYFSARGGRVISALENSETSTVVIV